MLKWPPYQTISHIFYQNLCLDGQIKSQWRLYFCNGSQCSISGGRIVDRWLDQLMGGLLSKSLHVLEILTSYLNMSEGTSGQRSYTEPEATGSRIWHHKQFGVQLQLLSTATAGLSFTYHSRSQLLFHQRCISNEGLALVLVTHTYVTSQGRKSWQTHVIQTETVIYWMTEGATAILTAFLLKYLII